MVNQHLLTLFAFFSFNESTTKGTNFRIVFVCFMFMCMFCKSNEVTLCGWWGYKPSINNNNNNNNRVCFVPPPAETLTVAYASDTALTGHSLAREGFLQRQKLRRNSSGKLSGCRYYIFMSHAEDDLQTTVDIFFEASQLFDLSCSSKWHHPKPFDSDRRCLVEQCARVLNSLVAHFPMMVPRLRNCCQDL